MVLQAMLCDVLARDDARHTMIAIENDEMAQAHGAEEPIGTLHGRGRVDRVRRGVHVRADVQVAVLR